MGTYLMMLYVSLEQEKAVKNLFNSKGWGFKKPDLSMTTDKLGPTYASIDDNESESEGETTSKGRTRSRPATREASKRTPAVKIIKQSPKSEKKTSKVRVQLRKGGKKSTENAEFQEILEEAELITASINPADDEGEGEEIEPFTVKVERDGNMGEDSDYEGEDGESNDEDMDDDFDDVTPSTSYLEAGAESTDISQETADTPKPAKRRKVTTKARERPTLPPVDMDDLEAMGDLSPIKNDDADDHSFCSQQLGTETKTSDLGIDDLKQEPTTSNKSCTQQLGTETKTSDLGIDDLKQEPTTSNKSFATNKRVPCNECGKTFSKKSNLRRHERTHGECEEECSICDRKFTSKESLKLHVSTVHLGVRFKCDDCDLLYMSPHSLKKHRLEKHEGFTYKCQECGSAYQSKSGLDAHRAKHTNKFKHVCSQCPKGFRSKQTYTDHMSMHAGLKPHGCHKCRKMFAQKCNLYRHLLSCGKTEKDFICSQCGVKFKSLRNLNDHVRQVHGNTQYSCHKCGKFYSSRPSLLKHFRLCGVTDLDFECGMCSKRFKSKGSLSEHVKQMHEQRMTAKCSECGEMFKFRSALHSHRKKTGHK